MGSTSNIDSFFMPCQVTEKGKLRAFVAPANHNSVSEHMVVDICNTMMGEYCGSNNLHMQEMGDDACVIVGWDDCTEVSYFQVLYTSYSNWNIMNNIAMFYIQQTELL